MEKVLYCLNSNEHQRFSNIQIGPTFIFRITVSTSEKPVGLFQFLNLIDFVCI